jgi:hypothetical protein
MRQYMRTSGTWLAGAGITAIIGYLISTISAGGHHPNWPYLLFGVLTVVGICLFFAGQGNSQISRGERPVSVPTMTPAYALQSRGTFTSPANGANVASKEVVNGSVIIGSRAEAWLLVRSIKSQIFTDHYKLFLDMHNRFQTPLWLIGSQGDEYLLLLVLANQKTSRKFYHDMPELPRGVQILDQRTVKLWYR